MSKQASKCIMMVRPKHFGYDPESAESNAFQVAEGAENIEEIQALALAEFDDAVDALRREGVRVEVIEDTNEPIKPNAIFPNNWVSFHDDLAILYPMMAVNRRAERRPEILSQASKAGATYKEIKDLSRFEIENKFLESTGSIIFDYANKRAYACKSERTHPEVFERLCELLGYEAVLFDSLDKDGKAIYHTNVMMCLAEQYAVICMESIPAAQRPIVKDKLERSGHSLVDITYDQVYAFAGNMLEVENMSGESVLVMSEAAKDSLSSAQKEELSGYSRLVSIPIPTIEKYGGGSIRCMMGRIN